MKLCSALLIALLCVGCLDEEQINTGNPAAEQLADGLTFEDGAFKPDPTPSPTPSPAPLPAGKVVVPDLYGMGVNETDYTIRISGLIPTDNKLDATWSPLPWGTTVNQSPVPGTIVDLGATVRVGSSFGPPPLSPMPSASVPPAIPTDISITRIKDTVGYTYTVTWADNAVNEFVYVVVVMVATAPANFYEPSFTLPPDSNSYTFKSEFEDPQEVTVQLFVINSAGSTSSEIVFFRGE